MTKKSLSKVLKNKTIGLDVDQVLVLSIIPVVEKVRSDLDKNFSLKDFKGWNSIKDYAVKKLGWDNEKALQYEDDIWTDPEILIKAPAVPGAKEFTKSLVELEIPFYIITSRIPKLKDSTYTWFSMNMPWVSRQQISINTKRNLDGHDFKHKKVKSLGVNLHIGDSPKHASLILKNTQSSVILVSNYPSAKKLKHSRLIKISRNDRLPNMNDVYEHLVSG